MKTYLVLLLVFLGSISSSRGQNVVRVTDSTSIDSLYREDQFYAGLGFNLLLNRPKGIRQSGFSGGLNFGFIRDMPINKRRNVALGVGLGWSANSYGFNLLIDESQPNPVYTKLERYKSNRLSLYLIEMPLEFRWRTSTPTSYKFWRIYGGLRVGYIHYSKIKSEYEDIRLAQYNLDELERLRYGLTFTFGYNTFNFTVYYSLNSLFDGSLKDSNVSVKLNPLKVGLTFYIL